MEKSCPDSAFYFRPYITKANQSPITNADSHSLSKNTSPNQNEAEALSASETWGDAEEFEQTFLWIYQKQWQKEMLAKNGNIMTFFDVTYKTTLYTILPYHSSSFGQMQCI